MAASVKVFGCRPDEGGAAHTEGPASANLHRSGLAMSVHRSAVSTTDQHFGSRCSGWRLLGKRHEPHRWPALDSADGEVPYFRKKSQFRAHSFGELYSHLLVDVEVFLAPNDLHGRLEPGKLRFEVILVSRKVRFRSCCSCRQTAGDPDSAGMRRRCRQCDHRCDRTAHR
jgi:hypothetical protein